MRALARILLGAMLLWTLAIPATAEVNEVRITKQPGLLYLPLIVMEENKLIEKHAKALGLPDLKVSWTLFNSGGAAVDALLSNNVDYVTSGCSNLLIAWAATNGQIKGVGGAGAIPMWLVTRNPNVKTIKDFTAADKIALPTIKVSSQATVLHIASEKEFGLADALKLDQYTVALGHPDALIALQTGRDVDAHFSLPPYEQQEIKFPGAHVILNSVDVAGGPISNGCVFSSTKFHDANPKAYAAVFAALGEAHDIIKKNHRLVAQLYLQNTGEKWAVDDLVAMLNDPKFVYSLAPQRSMKLADIMYRTGTIKKKADSWKDYFFAEVQNQPGS